MSTAWQGTLRAQALRIPPIAALRKDRDRWRRRARAAERKLAKIRTEAAPDRAQQHVREMVPPGHFYSPIPDLDDIRARSTQIFDRAAAAVPGVEVRAGEQIAALPALARHYPEQPFGEEPAGGLRYGFRNNYFSYGDGLALYGMLRELRPRRVIEVGSGWSSALVLDVNERYLDAGMRTTFVEPFPDRLNTLLRPADRATSEILELPLHAVPGSLFGELAAGDLLFIDSTHVCRVGSDVNRLFLEIIPALPAGVHVHVHDVFWPFEYPEDWVFGGRQWSEAYLLRALLIGNPGLQITWFNDYLRVHHHDEVAAAMPLWAKNCGGSIYLRTR